MWTYHAAPPLRLIASASLLTILTLSACSQSGLKPTSHRTIPTHYVEGSFLVSTQSTASDRDIGALASTVAAQLGCQANKPARINWGAAASSSPSEAASAVVSQAMQNTFHLTFGGCDFSDAGTQAILGKLAGGPAVLAAQPEAIASTSPILENDPDKTYQWQLADIHRDQACALADKSGPPVVVAVIDTGVDLTHPDLQGVLYKDANGAVIGANFVGSSSQMPPDGDVGDQNGHGTHVAGLIAAAANNGQGVVGVGACANVKIMPVRVMGANGSGSSIEIDRGIKWAVDHGAQILNLSLGYLAALEGSSDAAFNNAVMNDAFSKNVMVFAAAGNDGAVMGGAATNGEKVYSFPSAYNHVVAVAATDEQDQLTSFSNRGDRVAIAAPGLNDLSTCRGGGYCRMSGTSMATPVAAGAYALALATARLGLGSTQDRVDVSVGEQFLVSSAKSGAGLAGVQAGGVLDAEALTKSMAAAFPKSAGAAGAGAGSTAALTPATPAAPTAAAPAPAATFSFAGLTSGQQVAGPSTIGVQNLPLGTTVVYFFWGNTPWAFSRVYVTGGAASASDPELWYLYGTRNLTAVAFNAYGQVLGVSAVSLIGL